VAQTVYECPLCATRLLGERRCADCNRFCRALGIGGPCPHCDDLVVIADGEIRASGSREGLRSEHSGDRFELELDGDAGWLRSEPGVTVLEFAGGYALFEVDSPSTAQRVLQNAIQKAPVQKFSPQHPSLSQIFQEVIR
jgi:ABC-2 type transport system ATP-binding protein